MNLGELPVEVLILILKSLSSATNSQLASLALLSRSFADAAQHLLFSQINITSIESFDLLFRTLDRRIDSNLEEFSFEGGVGFLSDVEVNRANGVRKIQIKCSQYGVKGWGIRLGHLLRLCTRVQQLIVIGVEDLRVKYLFGQGELYFLSLQTTTFRANSLPSSPHLYQTLSNVTTLRLANLGLPSPCTHPFFILSSAPSLKHLEISDFRDLSPELFQSALTTLSTTSPLLQSLKIGNLLESQQQILPIVLSKFTSLISIEFKAPFNWIEECDFQVLPRSVQTVKLSSVKKEYGEVDTFNPILIALSKGFARKAKKLEVTNLYGTLRTKQLEVLREAVEAVGLIFSAQARIGS